MRFHGRRLAVHLSVVFVSLVLAVGLVLGVSQYLDNTRRLAAATEERFVISNEAISAKVSDIFRPAELAVELVSRNPLMAATTLADRLGYRRTFGRYLDDNPAFASAYVGYPDGDFMLVRQVDEPVVARAFDAPDGARYLVQAVERDAETGTRATYLFYDRRWREVARRDAPDYASYDPRTRPWFRLAWRSSNQVKTRPYIFFTTGEIGTTLARGNRGEAVAGLDITLDSLSEWLESLAPGRYGDVALIDADDRLLSTSTVSSTAAWWYRCR
jgi:hypothetical protein